MTQQVAAYSMHVVHLKRGADRQWYLALVAPNGETLAHSEGYRRKWNAKRAARKNFPGKQLIEVSA